MSQPINVELVTELVESFCDKLNLDIPDHGDELQQILNRMEQIGWLDHYECTNYIRAKMQQDVNY